MKASWPGKTSQRVRYFLELIASDRIKKTALQAIPFWMASLLTGLVAVGYTKLFGYTETLLQEVLHWHSWMIFVMTPLCFFAAWMVVQLFAPNARGSGIPQVMAAIELAAPRHEEKVRKLLSFRIIVTKIVSSLLMVLGGGAIGREGPTIQIAGSVFRMVHRWIPRSWPKLSELSFILTGAAAGLAAAFNTPLGGVVFAMEELARIHIRFFRTALFSAVIIAGLTAQALLGPYLYLGYPNVRNLQFSVFLAVAAAAILAGLLGALTSKLILRIKDWKSRFNKLGAIGYLVVGGLLIATISYFVDKHILGSGKALMATTLFTDNKQVSWYTALFRILGTTLCFNSGAAGGVFAPALAVGASIGAFLSGVFGFIGANANILILSGMVGFLTGVTRTPFTSAILVLEMTDRHSVIFHLMLAALLSNIAALMVDKHSLYETLKKDYLQDTMESNPDPARTVSTP